MTYASKIDYLQGALANGVISPQDALSQLMALQEAQKAAPAGIASGLREAAYAGAEAGTPLEQLLRDPSVAGAVQARPNKAMGILDSLYHTNPVPGGIPMAPDPMYGQSRVAPAIPDEEQASIINAVIRASTKGAALETVKKELHNTYRSALGDSYDILAGEIDKLIEQTYVKGTGI